MSRSTIMQEPHKTGPPRKLVVGIGASAGGLEACREFFAAMPPEPGMTFIVVMHLDRHRSSHLAEILQRSTSLTVTQAEGNRRLEVDHVYIIAPNTELSIDEERLRVEPREAHPEHEALVDALFASLCNSHGKRCAGIVLSGSGRDGASGLQAIHRAGGLCIAQNPETAQFRSMPEAAIDGGGAQLVLAPAEMPAALLEFASTGIRPELERAGSDETEDAERAGGDEAEDTGHASGFDAVLALLGERFDVDFHDYKEGTLRRRAERRMGVKNLRSWDEYAAYLQAHPDEVAALYQDVLIGVTAFFRDPEVWERLAREIPALVEGRAEKTVRAWVCGCATGEEAYTLAMLLFELLGGGGRRRRIQIYATDLSTAALAIARRGLYPADIARDISQERLERFFTARGDRLQIDPRIRDCVTFAPHNALTDAPFSRMDLVSCRNLLIYVRSAAHERLLKRFHFSLREGGLLLLGRSETSGRQSALFEEVSKRQSLYRARAAPSGHNYELTHRASDHIRGIEPPPATLGSPLSRDAGSQHRIEQFVLAHRTPARVVVDKDLQILHFYGDTYPYLTPPTGESRRELLSWVRAGFYIPLRAALKRAFDEGQAVTVEGQVDRNGQTCRVQCLIEPIPATSGAHELLLLTFSDVPVAQEAAQEIDHMQAEPLARQLEAELIDTRRELQSAVEQLEAAGEEYRASHEELLSLNEELQSSNEELEASKEELESLNEEMNTINKELEEKNLELRGANADLNNLFTSSGIPTIFLDRELQVRRFTLAATEVMRLVPADVGRSIEHIKERFEDNRLLADAKAVIEGGALLEAEIRTEDGRWFLRRVVPYRVDGRIDGVCITFSNITAQKRAMADSEAHRFYAEAIVRTVRTPLMVLDEQLRIVTTNPAFDETFHTHSADLKAAGIDAVEDERWNTEGLRPLLQDVLRQHEPVKDFEVASANATLLVNAYPMRRSEQSEQILMSIEDVTARRELQQATEQRAAELVEDAQRKDQWIAMLGHELRNPIGAISAGVELLVGGASADQARVRDMLRRQFSQVGRLLDDLLDAARIIAGKLEVAREPVDMAGVGEAALEATASLMEEKRHRVNVELPAPGEVYVLGDDARLMEVVVNLLMNAAKYTEAGGEIGLSVGAEGDTATLSVRDNGAGITAELMPRIFDVFTQGPRNLGRTNKGLGLGLPLVRSIVELHAGRVDAFSAGEGQGSLFKITLPRLDGAVQQTIPDAAARPSSPAPRAARATPRRVLIVEDDGDAASTLAQVLRNHGHDTRVAHTGPEALTAAAEFKPAVVLLDLGLPEMDGYEVAKRLRARDATLLLIAMTGYPNDEVRLREAGFDRHLLKPVNFVQLWGWLGSPPEA